MYLENLDVTVTDKVLIEAFREAGSEVTRVKLIRPKGCLGHGYVEFGSIEE